MLDKFRSLGKKVVKEVLGGTVNNHPQNRGPLVRVGYLACVDEIAMLTGPRFPPSSSRSDAAALAA